MSEFAPIIRDVPSHITGMVVSYVNTTDVSVSPGSCSDFTNVFDIVLPEDTTVSFNTVGANGLDTGSVEANNLYNLFAISDAGGYNPVACLMSLSDIPLLPDSPTNTFPAYSLYRRIGYVIVDESSEVRIVYVVGEGNVRTYQYNQYITLLTGGTQTAFTSLSTIGFLPDKTVQFELQTEYTPAVVTNTAGLRPGGSTSTTFRRIKGDVVSVGSRQSSISMVSILGGIQYQVTASDSLTLQILGFTDYL